MILSMTGFAAVAAELPGCSLTVELRSVNHRYLDLQVRLPDELRSVESLVRDTLAKQLKRGKVDCRVALNRSAPGTAELAVNAARIVQLRDAANEVLHHAPGSAPLSIVEILRWPGVLTEASLGAEALADKALALLKQALADLAASRAREGEQLKLILEERCRGIELQLERVAPRVPAIHDAYLDLFEEYQCTTLNTRILWTDAVCMPFFATCNNDNRCFSDNHNGPRTREILVGNWIHPLLERKQSERENVCFLITSYVSRTFLISMIGRPFWGKEYSTGMTR